MSSAGMDRVTGPAGRVVGAGRVRGHGAVRALQGAPVGPPMAGRRWPWAVLAGALGAVAGAATVLVLRRVLGQDDPGAQEPLHLVALVDRAPVA